MVIANKSMHVFQATFVEFVHVFQATFCMVLPLFQATFCCKERIITRKDNDFDAFLLIKQGIL